MAGTVMSVAKRKVQFQVMVSPQSAVVWELINKNRWEEGTFDILDRFLKEDQNYLDIGAWVGPTVLYGAHLAQHVYALEPDPVAFKELQENVALNVHGSAKVTLVHAALSHQTGTASLYKRREYGDSTSSLIPTISEQSCNVDCLTIEELIKQHKIKNLSLIKMDIEGSEYSVIPAMKAFLQAEKTPLYLSLHPAFLKEHLQRQSLSRDDVEVHFMQITRRLVESLTMYHYIYNAYGNLIDENVLLHEMNFSEYLFTNERLS